jgi:dienelactone hydrolase
VPANRSFRAQWLSDWRAISLAVVAGCLAATLGSSAQEATSAVDRAFQAFWSAPHAKAAADRAEAIVKTGVSFEEALTRIRHGRDYDGDVPRGLGIGRHRTFDGLEHEYVYVVPETYDPSRPYQVRVQLHGGMARARPPLVNRIRVDLLPSGVDEISVFPIGWVRSLWWSATQVDNLNRILDRLKRTYNVDENRVYLTGVSDGGTGVYFMAFKDPTPWSAFLPLIGNMLVLSSPSVRADGEMYPGNAVNKPLYIVNTGRDPSYPAHVMQLYADHLRRLGAPVVFRVYPELGHSTEWWPNERPEFESFVHDHPREPLPDTISWQTERVDRFNRAHWLIIDRLGAVEGESRLPDTNLLPGGRELDFGLRIHTALDRGRRAHEVVAGSNAFRIGLRTGDRLIEINGKPVLSGRDLAEGLQVWAVGDRLTFVVERHGDRTVLEGIFDPAEVDLPPTPIFPRRKPSGRVDLLRRGNVVEASTEGVRAFTLLLSPSIFDFRRPVKVVANGRTVFDGMVEPSVATMLKWAARDNDRTMVFGAELNIELDK